MLFHLAIVDEEVFRGTEDEPFLLTSVRAVCVSEGVCASMCGHLCSVPQRSISTGPDMTAQRNINIKGRLNKSMNKRATCSKFGMDRTHHPACFLFSTRTRARSFCSLAQTHPSSSSSKAWPQGEEAQHVQVGTSHMSCMKPVTKRIMAYNPVPRASRWCWQTWTPSSALPLTLGRWAATAAEAAQRFWLHVSQT